MTWLVRLMMAMHQCFRCSTSRAFYTGPTPTACLWNLRLRPQLVLIFSPRSKTVSFYRKFDVFSFHLDYWVPQGFVLGPNLFVLYVAPVNEIILSYKVGAPFYTKDTQLVSVQPRKPITSAAGSLYNDGLCQQGRRMVQSK